MQEVLEDEYKQFLSDIKDGSMSVGRYLDESEYEDEYSHNEIEDCQRRFIRQVREYLQENFPQKYIVSGSWCVFVMTVEEAKRRNIYHYEYYIA